MSEYISTTLEPKRKFEPTHPRSIPGSWSIKRSLNLNTGYPNWQKKLNIKSIYLHLVWVNGTAFPPKTIWRGITVKLLGYSGQFLMLPLKLESSIFLLYLWRNKSSIIISNYWNLEELGTLKRKLPLWHTKINPNYMINYPWPAASIMTAKL